MNIEKLIKDNSNIRDRYKQQLNSLPEKLKIRIATIGLLVIFSLAVIFIVMGFSSTSKEPNIKVKSYEKAE